MPSASVPWKFEYLPGLEWIQERPKGEPLIDGALSSRKAGVHGRLGLIRHLFENVPRQAVRRGGGSDERREEQGNVEGGDLREHGGADPSRRRVEAG